MDIRSITERYAVSPQIAPTDLVAIRDAGFATIIDNRPDAEVPQHLSSGPMRQAAEALGPGFVDNPVTHQGLDEATVARQREAIAASPGPVLAYCASGTRCTIVWALGEAGGRPADETVDLAAKAGYPDAAPPPIPVGRGGRGR